MINSLLLSFRSTAITGIVVLSAFFSMDFRTIEAKNLPISQIAIAKVNALNNSSDPWIDNRRTLLALGSILGSLAAAGIIYKKGVVMIGENEVGVLYKKFNLNPFQSRPASRQLIARSHEAGFQPDTLDDGWHWLLPCMYNVHKVPLIQIPPGEIALVFAHDGLSIPNDRILARVVDCDDFQDARAFLSNGGEKGRQLAILKGGTSYRINTKLFSIITRSNVKNHDSSLKPSDLLVYDVARDMVGIVTTSDGIPMDASKGETAGPIISGHDNFANPQKFIDGGGCRGLQEDVILSGEHHLNPWFAKVNQVPLTVIREGTVGVVVSLIGKSASNNAPYNSNVQTDSTATGYELVEEGFKGVWKNPLNVGSHPINTAVRRVVIVPTYQITLDWSNDNDKPIDNYDKKLGTLKLHLKDRILIEVVVRQRFRIPKENAPLMISQIGSPDDTSLEQVATSSAPTPKYKSIRDLIVRVLEPTIENYFINAVYDCEAEDFYLHRTDQQKEASNHLKEELKFHGVESIDTLIGEIDLPDEFDNLEIKRKLEVKKRKAIEEEIKTEDLSQRLAYSRAVSAAQNDLARSRINIEIAKMEAEVLIQNAIAEARAMREQGQAQADVEAALRRSIVDALGHRSYIEIEKLKELTKFKLPTIIGSSGATGSGLVVDTFLALIMENLADGKPEAISGTLETQLAALFSIDPDRRTHHLHDNRLGNTTISQLDGTTSMPTLSEGYGVCNNCNTQNPINHKYCLECGAQLLDSATIE
jgi:uncharacterized membrane protein YqiK